MSACLPSSIRKSGGIYVRSTNPVVRVMPLFPLPLRLPLLYVRRECPALVWASLIHQETVINALALYPPPSPSPSLIDTNETKNENEGRESGRVPAEQLLLPRAVPGGAGLAGVQGPPRQRAPGDSDHHEKRRPGTLRVSEWDEPRDAVQ